MGETERWVSKDERRIVKPNCKRAISKLAVLKKIGSPQRPRCGEMRHEGINIYSIEKFAFEVGIYSPTRTLARAEIWDDIRSITLRRKRISSITFPGELAIALGIPIGRSQSLNNLG